MERPLIGVTGPQRGGLAAWLFIWLAVRLAGGRAVRVTAGKNIDGASLDGLILGGGSDLDPALYSVSTSETLDRLTAEDEDKTSATAYLLRLVFYPALFLLRKLASSKGAGVIDHERDALEQRLLEEAAGRLPVLGICRGMQMLNVKRGGTLHGDIGHFYAETPNVESILPVKTVVIERATLLAKVTGRAQMKVNALHHQAVDSLGDGLRVAAREHNDLVQAIEDEGGAFMLGIQWHPEYLPHLREQRAIFRALVLAARTGRRGREP